MTLKLLQDPERLIEAFCQDCAIRGMTTETMRGYRSNLGIFAEYFTNVNILDINMERLRAFLVYLKQERGVKQKTVEQYFSALSAFYDYLVFEERTSQNIVLAFRRRYLKMYKKEYDSPQKKLLTREEMSQLVHSILDPRDKVIAVLLAKTGVRRGELLKMDVGDINWRDYSITLKPAPKRSNRVVFFDEEGARVLRRWLKTREQLTPSTKALFISYQTLNRLSRNGAYMAVMKYAKRLGFHDSTSSHLDDHFGPHCFRHWFTTFLLRNGMPREFVKELRGDRRREAIDIYHHIDRETLRKAYLACIPKLGI